MLSKKERLKKADFNRFFSIGKRYHHELFMLVYSPHKTFHASVVVPKKAEPHAVVRNKIRRRGYDAVRSVVGVKKYTGVYIIIANKKAVTASFRAFREGIEGVVGRIADTR